MVIKSFFQAWDSLLSLGTPGKGRKRGASAEQEVLWESKRPRRDAVAPVEAAGRREAQREPGPAPPGAEEGQAVDLVTPEPKRREAAQPGPLPAQPLGAPSPSSAGPYGAYRSPLARRKEPQPERTPALPLWRTRSTARALQEAGRVYLWPPGPTPPPLPQPQPPPPHYLTPPRGALAARPAELATPWGMPQPSPGPLDPTQSPAFQRLQAAAAATPQRDPAEVAAQEAAARRARARVDEIRRLIARAEALIPSGKGLPGRLNPEQIRAAKQEHATQLEAEQERLAALRARHPPGAPAQPGAEGAEAGASRPVSARHRLGQPPLAEAPQDRGDAPPRGRAPPRAKAQPEPAGEGAIDLLSDSEEGAGPQGDEEGEGDSDAVHFRSGSEGDVRRDLSEEEEESGPSAAEDEEEGDEKAEEEEEEEAARQALESVSVDGRRARPRKLLLTPHQKELVKRAFGAGAGDEVLISHRASGIDLTRALVRCLRSREWLNDEVVNLYVALLQERDAQRRKAGAPGPTSHFFHSFYLPRLLPPGGTYDYASVQRWTRGPKLKKGGQLSASVLDCEQLVWICHMGNHWTTAVADLKGQRLYYYDSLRGEAHEVMEALARYVADEYRDKKQRTVDTASWPISYPKDIPQQHNGCDCGVFALKFASVAGLGQPLRGAFSQRHMELFRLQIVAELLEGRVEDEA